jgi:hypothetical protein
MACYLSVSRRLLGVVVPPFDWHSCRGRVDPWMALKRVYLDFARIVIPTNNRSACVCLWVSDSLRFGRMVRYLDKSSVPCFGGRESCRGWWWSCGRIGIGLGGRSRRVGRNIDRRSIICAGIMACGVRRRRGVVCDFAIHQIRETDVGTGVLSPKLPQL